MSRYRIETGSAAGRSLKTAFWVGLGVIAVLVLLGAFTLRTRETPFREDKLLVRTTYSTGMATGNAGILSRLMLEYLEYKRKRHPNPMSWSFPVSPSSRCSVHGLLNQCMEVTGMQYLIEQRVAPGTVNFASAKVQNGAEWVTSFEKALKQGPVEWWDSERQSFCHEPLVLLRYDDNVTLVLSSAAAKKYLERFPKLTRD